jgi:adenosylcobyric acid synthase
MTARAVMVLGCTSGAGKSWLATSLCRHYARQGLRVAPFKAQNMSNHARVVPSPGGGLGEIGSAQYFQALAARVIPDVRMNPVLLKPEADTRSQVVVMGTANAALSAMGWRERSHLLSSVAEAAYRSLAADYDVIVIEGAGSPAEINLATEDYVNLSTARWSKARCLLVSDIDRGGSFAHLYGTHALMPPDVRAQVTGFVLNRFRGEPDLLSPAPEDLQRLTSVPTVAVVPYVHQHGLPEEDALPRGRSTGLGPRIAIVAGPAASNLDEFEGLLSAGIHVEFVRDRAGLTRSDWIILPGSKQTRVDLEWLRHTGMDEVIRDHAAQGRPVLGICGGLQLLGLCLEDPHGLEGAGAVTVDGLGLLSVKTRFESPKRVLKTAASFMLPPGPWERLNGLTIEGYEIHIGRTFGEFDTEVAVVDAAGGAIGWHRGSVLGLYLHGFLESPTVLNAMFGVSVPALDNALDHLADIVAMSFKPNVLNSLITP